MRYKIELSGILVVQALIVLSIFVVSSFAGEAIPKNEDRLKEAPQAESQSHKIGRTGKGGPGNEPITNVEMYVREIEAGYKDPNPPDPVRRR